MNEEKKFIKLTPFKMQVLQSFPFIDADFDALTNYELLCKVVEYLNITVDNVNLLESDFKILYDYVHDYFDNLDVQEEINNKLDEMAESGELADIIAQYLGLAGVLSFNTVADMKAAENLVNGSTARTLGYHSLNDGGSGIYKIRTITNDDVVDEASIIAIGSNDLIGELVTNEIYAEQFGCYGDDSHDDTTNLQKAITYCINNRKELKSNGDKVYKITNTLNFNDEINVDFNGATIKTNLEIKMMDFNNTTRNNQGVIKNLVIDMNSIATYGIYGTNLHKKVFDNIVIKNVSTVAYHIQAGFEVVIQNSHFFGNSVNSIGIESNTGDCVYKDIIMIDIHTAFKGGSGHTLTRVHAWIWTQALLEGSKFAHITGSGTFFFNNCYSDTMQYGFFIEQGCWAKIQLTGHYHFWNHNFFDDTIISAFSDPYIYFTYYNGNDGYNLSRAFKITASYLSGYENNQDVAKLCNLDSYNRQLCIDDHTVLWRFVDANRIIRNNITTLASNKVTIAESGNILSYFSGTANITLKLDVAERLDALNTVTVYQIPNYYRPINIKYFAIPYSENSSLKIDGMCLCIVESNGDVKLRPTNNIPVGSRLYMCIDYAPYRNV